MPLGQETGIVTQISLHMRDSDHGLWQCDMD